MKPSVQEAMQQFQSQNPTGWSRTEMVKFVAAACGMTEGQASEAIVDSAVGSGATTRQHAPRPSPQGQRGPLRPIYSQCQSEWKNNPSLQAKHKDFGAFVAHRRAELNGQNARGAK